MSTENNKKNYKRANSNSKVKKTSQNTKYKSKSSVKNTNAKPKKQYKKKPVEKVVKPPIKIAFLGGLNEIGKNLTVFECNDDIVILDCGMAFPDGDMLGVDLVIPDFTYLEQNKDRVKGIIITHGHEDHIGGLPYLLSKVNVPIYGTRLTIGLIENKLREHSLDKVSLQVVENGGHVKLGCFDIEMIHVNHSIPDSVGVAIHSPAGTIVHTGDFKIDCTPMSGGMINLSRFAQLGDQGVLALMADSTNASRPGFTATEQTVADSFDTLFRRAKHSRIIIATFASNISRVQQIINCASKYDRKVAFSGRSMVNYMNVAKELGYLEVPENIIIDIDRLKDYPMEKIVLVTTGSQGEPMSALSRMAYVVDELLKRGCEVVHESMYEVHVSGHACQEELKILHSLVKPQYFIPVHGEQKHLRKHMDIALSLGMKRENIFIGDIGKVVELSETQMKEVAAVPSGKVFVDGLGVGDVGSIVLRDRKHLGQDGLIIIVASLDVYDGHVISGPDIVSRGFVYVRESEGLLDEVKERALDILEDCAERNIHEWGVIKNKIKDDVAKLILQRTRRSPMILPILMEV